MLHKVYSGTEISKILGAKIISAPAAEVIVKDILIDSRRLISADNCMFFALATKSNDGHKYIQDLYAKGIRAFVVSRINEEYKTMPEATFFLVKDTLAALQKLTAHHRKSFNIPVVGITGSNGKTIVKEWLYQLLSKDKKVVRSPKSYNSQIGVPLSVWQMNDTHEMAIFEAGISEVEEMQKLQAIINPTIGIFTNIGEAHSKNFISLAQKIGEKLKLFTKVDTLIYSSDHKDLLEVIIRSGIRNNISTFSWGHNDESDLKITKISKAEKNTAVTGTYKEKSISINIPFIDDASIENAIHCWAVMLYLEYPNDEIAERMQHLVPIAMRLELKDGINNCTIINDTYNSDFNSLGIALDFLKQQNQHREMVLVLSDILQSGRNEADLYADVAALLVKKGIKQVIGIGPSISRQKEKFASLKSSFFSSTSDFIAEYPITKFSNSSILLKGARAFKFEQISHLLQQKAHETVLEINLDALIANLNYFRSKLPQNVKVMAMVKAFSYGSGGAEIANMLEFHNADYLAVAYADEGVELRRAGINLPIMVMSPEEHAFDTMIRHQLEPEIFSFRTLRLLEKAIKQSVLPLNKPVKVHVKLDTGMNRLGYAEDEIGQLIEKLQQNPLIHVQSVFSHLAASDKPEFEEFTRHQIEVFRNLSERFTKSFEHKIDLHILNSAGISKFPEGFFDMVRLGIGLYGIAGAEADQNKLHNVTTLRSALVQIRNVKKGESVGYNRAYIAEKDVTIGTVSIGYADGLMRNLGNGKLSLRIEGQEAPIVGDICMDMCMVDLSGINAKEGDDVIVFGEFNPVNKLAKEAGTIPYEILSRISQRVKRVYFHE
ncbi:MAG TPA: bifunctional UDP-N-acetylmuramoyl-tripeptide:D-alanyl-D-alanine ligase/alanine racemase [Bacteroidales bacterium]